MVARSPPRSRGSDPFFSSSLGSALGWTVKVVQLSGGTVEARSLRTAARTLVSFIATDGGQTVPAGDVIA